MGIWAGAKKAGGVVWRTLKRLFAPSKAGWTGASLWVWVIALFVLGAFFAGDVLRHYTIHKLTSFGWLIGMTVAMGLGTALVFVILRAFSARYRWALFMAIPIALPLFMAWWRVPGGPPVFIATVLGGSLFFGTLFTLRAHGWAPWRHVVTYLMGIVGGALLVLTYYGIATMNPETNEAIKAYVLEDRTLSLPDPGRTGPYEIETFSYGSGKDLHRPEFAGEADWISRSVDGSKLVGNWADGKSPKRTAYWGFDVTELPVQGRVWSPKGDGPFPLVLIVHGNHSMEDYSDPGYAYLGEMLASRGYIFVSVDENFLNGSFSSFGPPWETLGLRQENDGRGWMMLEHLAQWREWNTGQDHPFAGRVDIDRVGLIGHSRGGEAVAIAAAFNRLKHYPDDASLAFNYGFNIRGVIAIAPSDGQYRPRRRPTPLTDVNYFTIQGGMDGDVDSFMGASQWTRARFSGEAFRFKATLHVPFANHGQFNTGWGRHDYSPPVAWVLDTADIMPAEEQRQVAKVYFGAFLDATLKDETGYLPLFQDARYGAAWLPNAHYTNNYQDTTESFVAGYEEDLEVTTASTEGARIAGQNLSKWRETWVNLKYRPLESHVALLAWDDRFAEEAAEYEVSWEPGSAATAPDSALRFAAGRAAGSTLPPGWKKIGPNAEETQETGETQQSAAAQDFETLLHTAFRQVQALSTRLQHAALGFQDGGAEEEEDEKPPYLDWTVVVRDADGNEAHLPLSHDHGLYPRFEGYTLYAQSLAGHQVSEYTPRRFTFPLADFAKANPALDVNQITGVRFVFDKSKRGAVLIDDIGFAGPVPQADDATADEEMAETEENAPAEEDPDD